jgi:hypothetical protein
VAICNIDSTSSTDLGKLFVCYKIATNNQHYFYGFIISHFCNVVHGLGTHQLRVCSYVSIALKF